MGSPTRDLSNCPRCRPPTNRSPITAVRASGGQQPLRYYAAGNWPNSTLPISIDAESGRVTLVHSLGKKGRARVRSLQIPIVANDSAGRMAYSLLEVSTQDGNDNA